MALINRNQQIPGQNTYVLPDLNKIQQYGQLQFARPPMPIPQHNYRGQLVFNQPTRHIQAQAYINPSEAAGLYHMAPPAQAFQQFQTRGPHPIMIQSQQMSMYPAQYYQPAPPQMYNMPQQVVQRPQQIPTPIQTINQTPQNSGTPEQIPVTNVIQTVPAQPPPPPPPAVTPTIQQQPPPPVAQPLPVPQPVAQPLPEKKPSKRLVIKDPNTGRNILEDLPTVGKAEKGKKVNFLNLWQTLISKIDSWAS